MNKMGLSFHCAMSQRYAIGYKDYAMIQLFERVWDNRLGNRPKNFLGKIIKQI